MSEPGNQEVKTPTDSKAGASQKTVGDPPTSLDRIHVHGSLKGLTTTNKDVAEAVRESTLKDREDILRFPSQEDGLRMDRIHAYRERIGVPRKEIRILSLEDYAKVGKIVGNDREDISGGEYLPLQDVIIIKRDPDLESLNGTELIESLVIHEIAHSANGNSSTSVDVKLTNRRRKLMGLIGKNEDEISLSAHIGRSGFGVGRDKDEGVEGFFLEEGYAELERGLYVAQELGKPDGFAGDAQFGKSHLINKYKFFKRNTNTGKEGWTFPSGAIPAMTLELLIDHDPELLSALRESRRSVEGLREVARRIDAISPGLYQELRRFDIKSSGREIRTANLYEKVGDILQSNNSSVSIPTEPK